MEQPVRCEFFDDEIDSMGTFDPGTQRRTANVPSATVLPAAEVQANARTWRRVLEDYEPELLVCGLPKTMAGEEGPQAQRITNVAKKISDSCGIPLEFVDERLSSAEAKRILRCQGLNEKRMRGKVDMVAASLFLQTWLDNHTN
jgi:putative Holliday junction resolvase